MENENYFVSNLETGKEAAKTKGAKALRQLTPKKKK